MEGRGAGRTRSARARPALASVAAGVPRSLRGRRLPVSRHGAHRGREPGRAPRARRRARAGRSGAPAERDRRGPRLPARPRAAGDPPRHQAQQRDPPPGRLVLSGRLRLGAGQPGTGRRQHRGRHLRLHGPGAVPGTRAACHGHLRPRRHRADAARKPGTGSAAAPRARHRRARQPGRQRRTGRDRRAQAHARARSRPARHARRAAPGPAPIRLARAARAGPRVTQAAASPSRSVGNPRGMAALGGQDAPRMGTMGRRALRRLDPSRCPPRSTRRAARPAPPRPRGAQGGLQTPTRSPLARSPQPARAPAAHDRAAAGADRRPARRVGAVHGVAPDLSDVAVAVLRQRAAQGRRPLARDRRTRRRGAQARLRLAARRCRRGNPPRSHAAAHARGRRATARADRRSARRGRYRRRGAREEEREPPRAHRH